PLTRLAPASGGGPAHGVHPAGALRSAGPLERPPHSPSGAEPELGTSNFITSVLPSPLKSPASTFICGLVHQVAPSEVLKCPWPSERPTHSPSGAEPELGTSNFITSVLPSPLKSPANTS